MVTHFFPPNPDKLGDCLLTWSIALDISQEASELVYYATPFVAGVLERYSVNRIRYEHVSCTEMSFKIAWKLRQSNDAYVVDLQQLNCWLDYPEYRVWFDDDLPEQIRYPWDMLVNKEDICPCDFEAIFRSLINLPNINSLRPNLTIQTNAKIDQNKSVLIFPHSATDIQQLDGWPEIVKSLCKNGRAIIVVGARGMVDEITWPKGVAVLSGLSGGEVVDLTLSAYCCVGGATGLSHLSAYAGRPTLFIWGYDDSDIFAPPQQPFIEHLFPVNKNARTVKKDVCCFVDTYTTARGMEDCK